MGELVYVVGMSAVAVSAITGVLEAGRKPIDLFGVVLVALTSALGGGTMRDLLLGRQVFWVADQTYLVAAIAAGVATFVLVRLARLPANLFMVPDALGLALFTIIGTQAGLTYGAPWIVASLLGVVTGVFGGVLRDILCNEVPLVFAGELYATASWAGAVAFISLLHAGVAGSIASLIAMAAIFSLRLAAIYWHLTLPSFSAKA
ncbi:MAG: trimeric intracellular cation channel family protein [Betaproteobacteria bacterium]|nr:MAG: trimeric intracellular cation channel family protein [Betaproteobacteria bacterium]